MESSATDRSVASWMCARRRGACASAGRFRASASANAGDAAGAGAATAPMPSRIVLRSAIGDPAIIAAPYDAGWMLNRFSDVKSNQNR